MKSKETVAGLALENIQSLSAYKPGFQPDGSDWIKLNTNESPYPPSPLVFLRSRAADDFGALSRP